MISKGSSDTRKRGVTYVLRLNDEQVAVNELEQDPDNIDDIVLPTDLSQGNGVNVLIEDQTERNDKVETVESLGTDMVGENFDSVGNDERSEGDIVESVIEEDECDDGVSSCLVLVDGVLGGTDCLEEEHDKHSCSRGQAIR